MRELCTRAFYLSAGIQLVAFLCFQSDRVEAFVLISNGGNPAKWSSNSVTYNLHNIPSQFVSPINASFDQWANVSGVSLVFTQDTEDSSDPGTRDGRNTLSWVSSGWSSLSFRPPSNALAVTLSSFSAGSGAVVDADIYFNAVNFDWANVESVDEDAIDVRNIATHEIGHLVGIDHSSVNFFETDAELAEATMFYASGTGETSRQSVEVDDERAVRSLYPASGQELPAVQVTGASLVETFGTLAVFRVTGKNFTEQTSFILTANTNVVSDVVSRYRTIISSSEAEVQLNAGSFPISSGTLLAFNDVNNISSIEINLSEVVGSENGSSTQNLASSGGGGGCSASSNENSPLTMIALVVGMLGAAGLLFQRASRRPCYAPVASSQQVS